MCEKVKVFRINVPNKITPTQITCVSFLKNPNYANIISAKHKNYLYTYFPHTQHNNLFKPAHQLSSLSPRFLSSILPQTKSSSSILPVRFTCPILCIPCENLRKWKVKLLVWYCVVLLVTSSFSRLPASFESFDLHPFSIHATNAPSIQ